MNKFYILSILVILILVGGYFLFNQDTEEELTEEKEEEAVSNADNIVTSPNTNMIAIIQTNFGEIKLELFSSDAPKTVENFVNLVKEGFYDGTKFHRVIKNFMIQGGDPFTKDNSLKDRWGSGGPGYAFADEIHLNNHNVIGTISMANAGPNTNGSQFFINTNDNDFLDTKHTVFGKITDGLNIVRKIENVATEGPDRPIDDVIIESIKIIEN